MERFPITVWPRSLADLARPMVVSIPTVTVVDGTWLEYGPSHSGPRKLPPEVYLRELFDVDLTDPASVTQLVEHFGRLDQPVELDNERRYQDLPEWPDDDVVELVLERIAQREGWYESWGSRDFSHVDEVSLHIRTLRNCVRIWDAYTASDVRVGRSRMLAVWEGDYPPQFAFGPGTDRPFLGLLMYLGSVLRASLREFHPVVRFSRATDYEILTRTYPAMCLQFFNHIAEGAIYHRCANETCRRRFVRQRRETKRGQHRTKGVEYCTPNCARAQAQRQYRRKVSRRKNGAD